MTYYNGKAERERRERDTPDRIVRIAHSKGYFSVSMRYRDDWLRARCKALVKEGRLTGGRRDRGQFVFYPVNNNECPPST